MQEAVQKHCH